jgi:hypothetical protein
VGYRRRVSLQTALSKGRDSRIAARSTTVGSGFEGTASRISSLRRVWMSGWFARSQVVHVKAEDVVSWLLVVIKASAS